MDQTLQVVILALGVALPPLAICLLALRESAKHQARNEANLAKVVEVMAARQEYVERSIKALMEEGRDTHANLTNQAISLWDLATQRLIALNQPHSPMGPIMPPMGEIPRQPKEATPSGAPPSSVRLQQISPASYGHQDGAVRTVFPGKMHD